MPKESVSNSEIIDRRSVKLHRDRAAKHLNNYDFLFSEVAEMLADCLSDIRRNFSTALDVGCHTGQIEKLLAGRGGIEQFLQCDISEEMLCKTGGLRIVADEEFLPIRKGSLDLIISCLSLHWVNDLPGALIQMRHALKADGLFLVAFFGAETLKELRQSLIEAENEIVDGASPRVLSFTDIQGSGALLQRAGFALPVVDTNVLTVSYENPLKLMYDLRGMGEQMSAHARQKTFTRRDVLFRGAELYQANYGNSNGRIPVTFEVITLMAWAPSINQPKALRPGTGKISLVDVLNSKPESG